MSQNKFIVWGQPNCSYCNMAKALLKSKFMDFEYREISNGWTKEDLLDVLPLARGVPQIFVGDIHIGGYKELVEFLNSATF